jgi:hypothetical protein
MERERIARSGPKLSIETLEVVELLFQTADRERVKELLFHECGSNLFPRETYAQDMDRIRLAAIKCSNGKFPLLQDAVKLAKLDWRDLLVAAGFADDVEAHRGWRLSLHNR